VHEKCHLAYLLQWRGRLHARTDLSLSPHISTLRKPLLSKNSSWQTTLFIRAHRLPAGVTKRPYRNDWFKATFSWTGKTMSRNNIKNPLVLWSSEMSTISQNLRITSWTSGRSSYNLRFSTLSEESLIRANTNTVRKWNSELRTTPKKLRVF
jgi:hypothetical protein